MWTLLFLLFSAPAPHGAPVASEWAGQAPPSIAVSAPGEAVERGAAVDDGAQWVAGSRSDARVRRRRAKRINRRVERRPPIRTVRPKRVEEQRRVASAVSLRLQRASAVARRVARTTRRSQLPARSGSSDSRPPAT